MIYPCSSVEKSILEDSETIKELGRSRETRTDTALLFKQPVNSVKYEESLLDYIFQHLAPIGHIWGVLAGSVLPVFYSLRVL